MTPPLERSSISLSSTLNIQGSKYMCCVLKKVKVTKQATVWRWKNILRQCVCASATPIILSLSEYRRAGSIAVDTPLTVVKARRARRGSVPLLRFEPPAIV